MNATEYQSLLCAAMAAAGDKPDGWNARFRQAVESNGLQLSTVYQRPDEHLYPHGAPYAAPFPFGEDGAWPLGTRVIWRMPPQAHQRILTEEEATRMAMRFADQSRFPSCGPAIPCDPLPPMREQEPGMFDAMPKVVAGSQRIGPAPTGSGPFYRWPCGMFEDIGGPWQVFRYRPMPTTTAGDLVANFDSKEEADEAVADLNAKGDSLENARIIWGPAGQYVRRDMKARSNSRPTDLAGFSLFEIWVEGYRNESPEKFGTISVYVAARKVADAKGTTFRDACDRYFLSAVWAGDGPNPYTSEREPMYYGRRLFDNEADARRAAG